MAKTQIGYLIKNAQKKMKLTNFKVLENKYVLYLVLFLAIFDLMIFMIAGEISFIVIFILTGLITSYFSKNMIVIFTTAMVFTNVVKFGSGLRTKEGLTGLKNKDSFITPYYEGLSNEEKEFFNKVIEGEEDDLEGLDETEQNIYNALKEEAKNNNEESTTEGMTNKNGKKKSKEGKKNKESKKHKEGKKNKKNKSNFQPLKSEGLQGLELETEDLLEKQNKLMKNMQNLEPMLQRAENFMENLEKMEKISKKE